MSPASLFSSFFISLIGFALFRYGRKQERFIIILSGAALMVYPYFVDDWRVSVSVGVGILGLTYLAIRQGL
ncbi:MAG: hypothetical protein MK135_16465 [Polyangiaceae bacterium]|nr:hypothetical protein [Polyangiaceae bacterium]